MGDKPVIPWTPSPGGIVDQESSGGCGCLLGALAWFLVAALIYAPINLGIHVYRHFFEHPSFLTAPLPDTPGAVPTPYGTDIFLGAGMIFELGGPGNVRRV